LESLQRSPDPLAEFWRSPSKLKEGKGRNGRESGNKSPEWLQRSPDPLAAVQGSPSKQKEGREGRKRGNKSPEWLSQKLGKTANAAVNS